MSSVVEYSCFKLGRPGEGGSGGRAGATMTCDRVLATGLQMPSIGQSLDDTIGKAFRRLAHGRQVDLRRLGCFIRCVKAREILDLAESRLGIQSLRIAPGAFLEGRINEDLDELAACDEVANHLPLGAVWRNERADHDQTGVDHELGDLSGPSDVLDPVGFGEAEIAV